MSVPRSNRSAKAPATASPSPNTSSEAVATTRSSEVRGAIYDRILQAVLEHRLPPGTKLVEDRLAELFETSRAQVRDVLARLAHEGVVATVPNRGAFIASPTPDETRDIFEARRLIEPGLVRRLVGLRDANLLDGLRRLVEQEQQARSREDRPAIVRLSGEFHMQLAVCAGNRTLARTMRGLASLTCLAIFLYDAPHASSCREDEHERLLTAIARGRAERAAEFMLEHLNHIEASLDFTPAQDRQVDVAAVLMRR